MTGGLRLVSFFTRGRSATVRSVDLLGLANGSGSDTAALALMFLAAAGWYASSRAAAEALAGDRVAPGLRGIAQWLPTAIAVVGALLAGRSEIAVSIIFASSVAAVTLVLGILTIAARHTHPTLPRRIWAFILPVALILMLIGFSGGVRWIHVAILALEGLALLTLWNDAPIVRDEDGATLHRVEAAPKRRSLVGATVLLLVAMLAGAVAAWAGILSAVDLSHRLELPNAALVAALMLSPALVLSMIGSGSILANDGRYDEIVHATVAYVLLNLLALLPVSAVMWMTRPHWQPAVNSAYASYAHRPTTLPTTAPATTQSQSDPEPPAAPALPYPIAVWRIDTVILVALGLLLLPVALGRWSLGLPEGYALIITYTIYMFLTVWAAR